MDPPDPPSIELPPEVEAARAARDRRVGHYVLVEELGRGGMGSVWRGYDTTLHRPVAMKVMHEAGEEELRRFRREARAAARLRHPSIIAVHDVVERDGLPCIVMDLVRGEDLERVLARGALPQRQAAEVARELALALEHAHRNGVIHRDVKPRNVIVDRGGRPHLGDFGLARDDRAARLTVTGEVLGTPGYLSPEQADGAASRQGPAADIFGLGALLYRALVGKPPFPESSGPHALAMTLLSEPPRPRSRDATIARDLEAIVLRCLAKDPRARYPSAEALAADLDRWLTGRPVSARPASRFRRALLWAKREKALTAALIALIALVAALGALALRPSRTEIPPGATSQSRDPRALCSRALDLLDIGEPAEALSAANAAMALAPDRPEPCVARAQVRLFEPEKQPPLALADLERARLLSSGEPDAGWWTAYGRALLFTGRDDEALSALRKACDLAPRDPRALTQLAEHEIVHGRRQAAAKRLDEALAISPRFPPALLQRGKNRRELGDYVGARSDLELLVGLAPRCPEFHLELASVLDRLGAVQDVASQIALAVQLAPVGSRAHDSALVRRAIFLSNRDPPRARADAEAVLADDPRNAAALAVLANSLALTGQHAEAIRVATRAIEQDGKSWLGYVSRGTARLVSGDLDGAVRDLTRAIELDPRRPSGYVILSEAHYRKHDLDHAIEDARKALELDEKLPEAWYDLARARAERQEVDEAVADVTKAIVLTPEGSTPAEAHAFRAKLRATKEDWRGAVEDAEAADGFPDPELPLVRGWAHMKLGHADEAKAWLRRFLEASPSHERARDAREALDRLERAGQR